MNKSLWIKNLTKALWTHKSDLLIGNFLLQHLYSPTVSKQRNVSVEWPLSYANDRKQQELQNNVDFREEAGVKRSGDHRETTFILEGVTLVQKSKIMHAGISEGSSWRPKSPRFSHIILPGEKKKYRLMLKESSVGNPPSLWCSVMGWPRNSWEITAKWGSVVWIVHPWVMDPVCPSDLHV